MLLALSLELGYPVDAAYKPLVDSWAEREMKKLRTRFGSRLVPAKDLLADIIKRRGIVRAVAMVADQEPTTSEHKHWTRFLNRDTAFYTGPEELARVTRFPTFFIRVQAHRAWLRDAVHAVVVPGRGACARGNSPSATRTWSKRRSTLHRLTGPGRTALETEKVAVSESHARGG